MAGSAGGERTARANVAAFDRWEIVPRVMTDVGQRSLAVELFGERLPAPVLLAPIGVLSLVHPEGELAAARAAAELGVPYVLSCASSHPIEEVAQAMGDGRRWFQLYWSRDRELNASLVGRAERAGFSAIVVTLDTKILGWRERDLARGYLPFLRGEGVANYLSDPVFRSRLGRPPEEDPAGAAAQFLGLALDPTLAWPDLAHLRERTRLPIVLKGILRAEDAERAVAAGAAAVVVSNHGGRQVDGSVPALSVLPDVVRSVGGRVPVLFDSGLRRGADALKALALGARAVLLGRPYVWGLALDGVAGVRSVIERFLAEIDLTMGLSGCADLAGFDAGMLRPAGPDGRR